MRRNFPWLAALLDRLQPNESVVLGGAALLVGLLSALGIWVFKRLIDIVQHLAFEQVFPRLQPLGGWTIALLPVAGGLLVGLVVHFLVGEERQHGVAGIMEAVALAGGRLRYRRVPARTLAAAISIGSGAAVGPEDPSVQIGANLGSAFGQWLRLSDERVRTLVAAGAAGGVAAAFNAPIAGSFFALEIILGEIGGSAVGVVLVSAVVSAVTTQALVGPQPAFSVPAYEFRSALELPFYLLLGLLAGPLGATFTRLLYLAQDWFARLRLPRPARTALAGLLVGVTGIFLPRVFGVGYESIEAALNGRDLGLWMLLALLIARLVLTPVSLGGGFQGGVFAPSLFLGAMLGGAFGLGADLLFPGLAIDPPAFAMVGMAAVLAGTVHAPLTAILLLFEMTHDYRIILPLMFAVAVSLVLSRWMQKDSIYAVGLARKGVRLERGRDVDVLETLTVEEVMQPGGDVLHESDALDQADEYFTRTHHHGLPVVDAAGHLVGVLTVQDVDRAHGDAALTEGVTVGDACSRDLLTAFPDETLDVALRRMSTRDIGRLPVVAREDPRRVLGVIGRVDLVRAYDLALTRRAARRHRHRQVRLDAAQPNEAGVLEVTVAPGAPCDGQRLRDIVWPRDCVVASVRRGRTLIIPRGATELRAGDVLTVVADAPVHDLVRTLASGEEPS